MIFGNLRRDLRQAFRSLLKSPGYTVIAVVTLGLGIGMSTTSFCTIDSLRWRHLPYPQSEDLVCIFRTSKVATAFAHSPAAFLDVRQQARSFSAISTGNYLGLDFVYGNAPAESIGAFAVSGCFFDLLKVRPELGRGFTAEDERGGAPLVVIITHRMWQQRFGADPGIVGRSIRLSRQTYTIVGVLPSAFDVPSFWGNIEVFYPFLIHPNFATLRDNRWVQIIARLKPGVSVSQAQAELDLIGERLAREYPKDHDGDGFKVLDFRTAYWRTSDTVVTGLMLGLSALVLLSACINLAGLQLVRCLARKRELAVRSALGASQWQAMSPLVVESLVLAIGGALCGLFVAAWATEIIGRFILFDPSLPMVIPIDARALGVTAVIAVLSGFGFGFLPALIAVRINPVGALNEAGRSGTESRSDSRVRPVLIVAEIAIALVLICTATSFAAACASVANRQLGWNTSNLFHGVFFLPFDPYGRDETVGRRFIEEIERDLAALPGVRHAAVARMSPFWGFYGQTGFLVEGRSAPDPGKEPMAAVSGVSPGYFATLEVPLLRGRAFAPTDRFDTPRVAIINQTMAYTLWSNANPIGQRIRTRTPGEKESAEIVGVVADIGYADEFEKPATRFQIYLPEAQGTTGSVPQCLLLRIEGDPAGYAAGVQAVLKAKDPDLSLTQMGSAQSLMRRHNRFFDTIAGNLVVFATIALLIATIGLYGVIATLTAMRMRSIAVRVALGAMYGDIMNLILGHGLRLVAIGLLIGAALTYALIRVLATQIPGLDLPGSWIIAAGMVVLAAVGLLASWLPAHRAARVDPAIVLRTE